MSTDFERLVAERIRARRTELNISGRTLAIRMLQQGHGWHQQTVARIETDQRQVRLGELAALAIALRTSVTDLLGLDDEATAMADVRQALASDLRDSRTQIADLQARADKAERNLIEIIHTVKRIADGAR